MADNKSEIKFEIKETVGVLSESAKVSCTPKTGPLAKVEKRLIFHSRRPTNENRTTPT
jgi:hypothetical protein